MQDFGISDFCCGRFVYFYGFCIISYSPPMVWNDEKEVLLLREAATVEPHKFKEKTKKRGQCWQRMCENLRLLPGFQSL